MSTSPLPPAPCSSWLTCLLQSGLWSDLICLSRALAFVRGWRGSFRFSCFASTHPLGCAGSLRISNSRHCSCFLGFCYHLQIPSASWRERRGAGRVPGLACNSVQLCCVRRGMERASVGRTKEPCARGSPAQSGLHPGAEQCVWGCLTPSKLVWWVGARSYLDRGF